MIKKILLAVAMAAAAITSLGVPGAAPVHAATTDFCTFYGGPSIFGFPPPSSDQWNWFTGNVVDYGNNDKAYTALGIYPHTAGGGQCQLQIALRVYYYNGGGYGGPGALLTPPPQLRGWYNGTYQGMSGLPTSWYNGHQTAPLGGWGWTDTAIWGPAIFDPSFQLGWDNYGQQFTQGFGSGQFPMPYVGYNCPGHYNTCTAHG